MIHLEPFVEADFKLLQSWISNEKTLTNWAGNLFTYPLTDRSLSWYIKDTNISGKSDAFVFKAVHSETLQTVGHISLGGLSWKNRSARISRVMISPEYVGQGFCKPMMQAALKVGFEILNLHRIGLGVYTHNISAIKCYQNAGLVAEGEQRDVLWTGTEFWSMLEMAILEDDWKKLNE